MHCIIMFIFSIKSYYVNLIIKYLQIYAQRWNHQVQNSLAVIIVTAQCPRCTPVFYDVNQNFKINRR